MENVKMFFDDTEVVEESVGVEKEEEEGEEKEEETAEETPSSE